MVGKVVVEGLKFAGKVILISAGALVTAEVGAAGAQAVCNDYAVLNAKKLTQPQVVKVSKNPFSKTAKVTITTKDLHQKGVNHKYIVRVNKKSVKQLSNNV